jgi:hypothetical protein
LGRSRLSPWRWLGLAWFAVLTMPNLYFVFMF